MPLLGIAAELSAPPSSPSCYRDVCLWAKTYRRYDVLALCPAEHIDFYVPWMRLYGLFDFIDDILPREQVGVMAVEIEGGPGSKITAHNLGEVLRWL